MKILVLGDTGFLGINAVNYFCKKYPDSQIIGVSKSAACSNTLEHKNYWHEYADLTDKKSCERVFEHKPNVVLQLAASTTNSKDVVERPWIHVTDNAIMNSHIFKCAHEAGVGHVIFTSCTTMYPGDLGRPAEETDFERDRIYSKYFGVATTKVYIEDMCEFWAGLGKTKFTAIRHSNIYGPHDRFDQATAHVCGATIKKVVDSSEEKPIEVWGDGSEIRDLLYVDDLMEAFNTIINNQTNKYELLNIGYGEGLSVIKLTKTIRTLAGKTSDIKYNGAAPTLKFNLVLNCKKILNKFGWRPTTNLDIGLEKTIKWYKENI